MDMAFKREFLSLWGKYMNDAELPITLYYTDEQEHAELVQPGTVSRCLIGALARVRNGKPSCFDVDSVACFGGKRYLGFYDGLRPDFAYFLSCGIEGKVEGERYKKTPEIVNELMKRLPVFRAPARFAVFKRWDALEEADRPEVAIFFAQPDVLAGLFTLAGFDEADPNSVIAPFGAGCATVVQWPYLEKDKERPRGVIGLFDISARPYIPSDRLTFAVPMSKLVRMAADMDESFLTMASWKKVQRRIGSAGAEEVDLP